MNKKKILTIITILTISTSLVVGCGKKEGADNNTNNTKDTTITTDKVIEETSTENITESQEPGMEKVDVEEELKKDNTVGNAYYLKKEVKEDAENVQEEMFALVDEAGIANREIILTNEKSNGNTLVALYSDETLKNVKLYTIDSDKLAAANNDMATYVESSLDGTESVDIADTVESDVFTVIRCTASETPTQVLVWENEAGEKSYIEIK